MKLNSVTILIFAYAILCFPVWAEEPRAINIFKEVRCLVCQGQSVAESNSDFALTLKLVVKDLIKEGKNENEIYSFLTEKIW